MLLLGFLQKVNAKKKGLPLSSFYLCLTLVNEHHYDLNFGPLIVSTLGGSTLSL